MHRTSIFNLLYKAALRKETEIHSASTSQSDKKDLIKSAAKQAEADLKRLQRLPPASHKWTWDENLTKSEVLALRRTGTWPGRRSHSGYNVSLKDGKQTGDYSNYPSINIPHGQFEDISVIVQTSPPHFFDISSILL